MKMPNLLLPNLPTNSGLSSTRQWRGSWWYRSIWKKRSHSGVIAVLHRRENLLKDWKIKRWLIWREQISVTDIRAVLHKIKTILLWGEQKSRRARTLRDEKGWRSSFILLSILRCMILSGVVKHPNHSCKYPKYTMDLQYSSHAQVHGAFR